MDDLIGANLLLAAIKLDFPLPLEHGNNLGGQFAMQRLMEKSGGWVLLITAKIPDWNLADVAFLQSATRTMVEGALAPEFAV